MSTETKAYTPGAERAARQIGGVPITNGFYEVTRSEILAAEIISRETRDAEMLEALKTLTLLIRNAKDVFGNLAASWFIDSNSFKNAEAIIAKVDR